MVLDLSGQMLSGLSQNGTDSFQIDDSVTDECQFHNTGIGAKLFYGIG